MGLALNSHLVCRAMNRAVLLDFFRRALSVEIRSRVHLPVELRQEHERDPGIKGRRTDQALLNHGPGINPIRAAKGSDKGQC